MSSRWLVRLPNWIGDAVMALPALRSLPAEMKLAGAAHPRVHPLYQATGRFDALWPAEGALAPLSLWGQVRGWRPQGCLVFTQAASGKILAFLSGAPEKIGWGSGPWTRRPPAFTRSRPLWESYADLAALAGGKDAAPDFRLDPGEEARAAAKELWEPETPVIGLAPGATYGAAKRWPYFEALQSELHRVGFQTAVFGGPGESRHPLQQQAHHSLAGKLSLAGSIAAMARCRALVSNDSGAMHLGRAAGTLVVGVFGSTSPVWTGPTSGEGTAVSLNLPCSPCFRRRCPLKGAAYEACLRDLPVERVLSVVDSRVSSS